MSLFEDVPLDYVGNLKYRLALHKACSKSKDVREAYWQACEREPLYFFSTATWLYEPRPRPGLPKKIPFTIWEHQITVIQDIYDNLGYRDIGVTKSRGEGMSWIAVLLALHSWLFKPHSSVGMVSKTESDADNPRNPDSLFWKIDRHLEWLPHWMVGNRGSDWERSLKDHVLYNRRNGSTIRAYSCTGDVASGGRMTWMLMDELAKFKRGPDQEAMDSTQHVTESRLVVSTPKGSTGAYFNWMHSLSNMKKVELDWKDNPYRNRGLYRLEKGNIAVACDPEKNPLHEEYDPPNQDVLDRWTRLRLKGFILENTVRSPWYDYECDRPGATPQSIAQELDRSYGGSMFRAFREDVFERVEETVKPPTLKGSIVVREDGDEVSWSEDNEGEAILWCRLDVKDSPPKSRYVVSCDISTGVAGDFTSNSVIQVFDQMRQEQVMEYATNAVLPSDFADIAIAVCHWFHKAFLIWEHNGPGNAFTARVRKKRYPHVYERKVLWKGKRHARTTDIGFWTDDKTKEIIFDQGSIMLRSGEWIIHSKDLVTEMGQYVRDRGKIEYCSNVTNELNNAASHGDRVMAMLIGLYACHSRPIDRPNALKAEYTLESAPVNTMAARVKSWEDEERKKKEKDVWDDVESSDLTRRTFGKDWKKEAALYLG